jgi:hypothetical protein
MSASGSHPPVSTVVSLTDGKAGRFEALYRNSLYRKYYEDTFRNKSFVLHHLK